MTSRNASVDIGKFIAAIFVIGIHTRPLSAISGVADFFLCDIVFRTAVPFFAVCTGYYLSLGLKDKRNNRPPRKTIVRILLLYVVWSLFYLLVLSYSWNKIGLLSNASFIGWSKSFLLGNSYYHLWYLAQLFWALIPFFLIERYVSDKFKVVLAATLWILGSFCYVYSDVLGIGGVFAGLYYRFGAITGSIGRMLPLLLIGNLIANRTGYSKRTITNGFILCLLGLVAEVFLIRQFGAERFSYVLFTLPFAYFLFISVKTAALRLGFNTRVLSKASMNVYLLHPAVLVLLKELHINDPIVLFCLCLVITSLICIAFAFSTSAKKTKLE